MKLVPAFAAVTGLFAFVAIATQVPPALLTLQDLVGDETAVKSLISNITNQFHLNIEAKNQSYGCASDKVVYRRA